MKQRNLSFKFDVAPRKFSRFFVYANDCTAVRQVHVVICRVSITTIFTGPNRDVFDASVAIAIFVKLV